MGNDVNDPDVIDFSDELRNRLADHLARHDRRSTALDGRKHAAVGIVDDARLEPSDEAALGIIEVLGIVERKRGEQRRVGGPD